MAAALKSAPMSYRWDLEWVLDHVPIFGLSRMLDLGCGVGGVMLRAAARGWKVHGQDVSVNACRAVNDVLGLPATNGTLQDLVEEGRQFELITAFHLLEHLQDPLTFTRLARRVVVDGGYLGIAVPNYDSFTVRHTTNAQWLPPFHINYFTKRSLTHLLGACSFRIDCSCVRVMSWGGIEGPKCKRYALLPYLIANSLIGRLKGNIVALVARAC
jgi:2-polyprenyl-3-methyl-5-hydroxy-6-metoxy-1,4-benzoquinol methylase